MSNPIYLDYQATTPIDPLVLDAMMPYLTERFANPSSNSVLGNEVNKNIADARKIIADSLNCSQNEIFFTSSATESINAGIKGFLSNETSGNIITPRTEHSAVLNTFKSIENRGIQAKYLNVENDGLLDLDLFKNSLDSETKLVSVMHCNNEIGVIQDIELIGNICTDKGVPLFVDVAQSYGKISIDVKKWNISMLSISGHKIYAPKGIGVLFIDQKIQSRIQPLIHGGGQENGLRSGTLNVAGIIGLAKAAEISFSTIKSEQARILNLRGQFLNLLTENLSDIHINGDMEKRIAGNLNLSFKNVSGDVLYNQLHNVIVSRGSACNSTKNQGSHVLKAIGLSDDLADSALRISFGRYTKEDEVNLAAKKIISTVNKIRKISNLE